MSDETATAAKVEEPAPAVTPASEPKPETPDWEKAYKGLQTTVNRMHQSLDQKTAALAAQAAPLRSGVDTLLRNSLGEEGFQQHRETERLDQERQSALAAAQTAQQFIPQSISVIAESLRLSGVSEAAIEKVFASAANTTSVEDWAEAVKAGTRVAISGARSQETTNVEARLRSTSKEEIAAEANALAERTLRTKGIDKIDLGKGQSVSDRGFVSKVRSIDRGTSEGEAVYQQMLKEAKRGTLKTT